MPEWMPRVRSSWAWPPKKQLIPAMALGAFIVLVAVFASFWFLDKRVQSIKAQGNETKFSVRQPSQSLKPLPDAWESVINEIYSADNRAAPPAEVTAAPPPRYVSNARALPLVPPGTPKIAIVIDDVGVNAVLSQRAEETLPVEVTFSYLPYGSATNSLAKIARDKGREVMIHLPMEPIPRPEEPPINPGQDALFVDLDEAEIRARVKKNLQSLKAIAVGVNNHMGSRFTSYQEGLEAALDEINKEGLFFLDSLTTHLSAVKPAAKAVAPGMPVLVRDIFLDHYLTEEALIKALVALEDAARKDGKVIAIGHPHTRTTQVLEKWIPTLEHKGIALVPISHILPEDGMKEAQPVPVLAPAVPVKEEEENDRRIYPD